LARQRLHPTPAYHCNPCPELRRRSTLTGPSYALRTACVLGNHRDDWIAQYSRNVVVGWAFQFIGHAFEGKLTEFLRIGDSCWWPAAGGPRRFADASSSEQGSGDQGPEQKVAK